MALPAHSPIMAAAQLRLSMDATRDKNVKSSSSFTFAVTTTGAALFNTTCNNQSSIIDGASSASSEELVASLGRSPLAVWALEASNMTGLLHDTIPDKEKVHSIVSVAQTSTVPLGRHYPEGSLVSPLVAALISTGDILLFHATAIPKSSEVDEDEEECSPRFEFGIHVDMFQTDLWKVALEPLATLTRKEQLDRQEHSPGFQPTVPKLLKVLCMEHHYWKKPVDDTTTPDRIIGFEFTFIVDDGNGVVRSAAKTRILLASLVQPTKRGFMRLLFSPKGSQESGIGYHGTIISSKWDGDATTTQEVTAGSNAFKNAHEVPGAVQPFEVVSTQPEKSNNFIDQFALPILSLKSAAKVSKALAKKKVSSNNIDPHSDFAITDIDVDVLNVSLHGVSHFENHCVPIRGRGGDGGLQSTDDIATHTTFQSMLLAEVSNDNDVDDVVVTGDENVAQTVTKANPTDEDHASVHAEQAPAHDSHTAVCGSAVVVEDETVPSSTDEENEEDEVFDDEYVYDDDDYYTDDEYDYDDNYAPHYDEDRSDLDPSEDVEDRVQQVWQPEQCLSTRFVKKKLTNLVGRKEQSPTNDGGHQRKFKDVAPSKLAEELTASSKKFSSVNGMIQLAKDAVSTDMVRSKVIKVAGSTRHSVASSSEFLGSLSSTLLNPEVIIPESGVTSHGSAPLVTQAVSETLSNTIFLFNRLGVFVLDPFASVRSRQASQVSSSMELLLDAREDPRFFIDLAEHYNLRRRAFSSTQYDILDMTYSKNVSARTAEKSRLDKENENEGSRQMFLRQNASASVEEKDVDPSLKEHPVHPATRPFRSSAFPLVSLGAVADPPSPSGVVHVRHYFLFAEREEICCFHTAFHLTVQAHKTSVKLSCRPFKCSPLSFLKLSARATVLSADSGAAAHAMTSARAFTGGSVLVSPTPSAPSEKSTSFFLSAAFGNNVLVSINEAATSSSLVINALYPTCGAVTAPNPTLVLRKREKMEFDMEGDHLTGGGWDPSLFPSDLMDPEYTATSTDHETLITPYNCRVVDGTTAATTTLGTTTSGHQLPLQDAALVGPFLSTTATGKRWEASASAEIGHGFDFVVSVGSGGRYVFFGASASHTSNNEEGHQFPFLALEMTNNKTPSTEKDNNQDGTMDGKDDDRLVAAKEEGDQQPDEHEIVQTTAFDFLGSHDPDGGQFTTSRVLTLAASTDGAAASPSTAFVAVLADGSIRSQSLVANGDDGDDNHSSVAFPPFYIWSETDEVSAATVLHVPCMDGGKTHTFVVAAASTTRNQWKILQVKIPATTSSSISAPENMVTMICEDDLVEFNNTAAEESGGDRQPSASFVPADIEDEQTAAKKKTVQPPSLSKAFTALQLLQTESQGSTVFAVFTATREAEEETGATSFQSNNNDGIEEKVTLQGVTLHIQPDGSMEKLVSQRLRFDEEGGGMEPTSTKKRKRTAVTSPTLFSKPSYGSVTALSGGTTAGLHQPGHSFFTASHLVAAVGFSSGMVRFVTFTTTKYSSVLRLGKKEDGFFAWAKKEAQLGLLPIRDLTASDDVYATSKCWLPSAVRKGSRYALHSAKKQFLLATSQTTWTAICGRHAFSLLGSIRPQPFVHNEDSNPDDIERWMVSQQPIFVKAEQIHFVCDTDDGNALSSYLAPASCSIVSTALKSKETATSEHKKALHAVVLESHTGTFSVCSVPQQASSSDTSPGAPSLTSATRFLVNEPLRPHLEPQETLPPPPSTTTRDIPSLSKLFRNALVTSTTKPMFDEQQKKTSNSIWTVVETRPVRAPSAALLVLSLVERDQPNTEACEASALLLVNPFTTGRPIFDQHLLLPRTTEPTEAARSVAGTCFYLMSNATKVQHTTYVAVAGDDEVKIMKISSGSSSSSTSTSYTTGFTLDEVASWSSIYAKRQSLRTTSTAKAASDPHTPPTGFAREAITAVHTAYEGTFHNKLFVCVASASRIVVLTLDLEGEESGHGKERSGSAAAPNSSSQSVSALAMDTPNNDNNGATNGLREYEIFGSNRKGSSAAQQNGLRSVLAAGVIEVKLVIDATGRHTVSGSKPMMTLEATSTANTTFKMFFM